MAASFSLDSDINDNANLIKITVDDSSKDFLLYIYSDYLKFKTSFIATCTSW